jgi:hypothetical protein
MAALSNAHNDCRVVHPIGLACNVRTCLLLGQFFCDRERDRLSLLLFPESPRDSRICGITVGRSASRCREVIFRRHKLQSEQITELDLNSPTRLQIKRMIDRSS